MDERRRVPRQVLDVEVRVATEAERPMPSASTVDGSATGLLVAFSEPVGLVPGARTCVTCRLPDGWVHLVASVARATRGDDFRTYVAIELDEARSDLQLERWRDWLVARARREAA